MISIIVPMRNSEKTIKTCLDSILNSEFKDYEIVIADGGSTDNSVKIVKEFKVKNLRLIESKDNEAAAGRNNGTKVARGDILFFVDSDVVIKKNTLTIVNESFKDKNVVVVCGIYDKTSLNKNFFPMFDTLWKHYEWVNSESENCDFFPTARSAIRKSVFQDVGGFNEALPGTIALEDLEFGWRLMRKGYKMHLNKDIRVVHSGPSFFRSLVMFNKRSFHYFRLLLKKKRFENVKTTPTAAINALISSLFFIFLPFDTFLSTAFLFLHLLINAGLYSFLIKEKGIIFTFASLWTLNLLHLSVFLGVLLSILTLPFGDSYGIR